MACIFVQTDKQRGSTSPCQSVCLNSICRTALADPRRVSPHRSRDHQCRPNPEKETRSVATRLLPAEGAALSEAGLATGGLAQHSRAALADDDGLGVRENGGDGEAAGALDVHEERAGTGDEGLATC